MQLMHTGLALPLLKWYTGRQSTVKVVPPFACSLLVIFFIDRVLQTFIYNVAPKGHRPVNAVNETHDSCYVGSK